MNCFVFRNNTIERFFPKGYSFSGYDDITSIPKDVDGYVWFYQLPIRTDEASLCEELGSYTAKLPIVLNEIGQVKPIYLITMDVLFSVPMTNGAPLMKAVGDYNASLLRFAEENPNAKILDICEFTRKYPAEELIDWKFWFLSQMGLNPRLAKPFMEWFERKLDQVSLKRKKCLVLDLDNTLWGGILGEDGIDGIKLSGDYPGKAFHYFQESLQKLGSNGIILTICSKNNESDVLEALASNPYMVLKKDDFAARRINWKDKASNIREIAEELNIGMDSMVFVDDNPTERELIRQTLPMVEVPNFPTQPYELLKFAKELNETYFRVYDITDEDKQKTAQYKANALRSQSQATFTDLDSFIKSLGISIKIEPANDFNIQRIAQMTQKTNQFNLTTKRYSESDIRSYIGSGWKVYCMSVSDRFGDYGITGCMFLNGEEIDTLLLSCRILGKGIEYAFVKSILQLLKNMGYNSVKGNYLPTAKNGQVSDFYDRCGFTHISTENNGSKHYYADLANTDLSFKHYYTITTI